VSKGSTRRHRKARVLLLATATRCHLCGQPFTDPTDPPVADHLIPRSRGGPDAPFNYAAAHRSCNAKRGDKPIVSTPPPATHPRLLVRNPPLEPGQPEPTAESHPHLVIDVDPDTGEKHWWPRWSRDW
jgi:hypothetical protein